MQAGAETGEERMDTALAGFSATRSVFSIIPAKRKCDSIGEVPKVRLTKFGLLCTKGDVALAAGVRHKSR